MANWCRPGVWATAAGCLFGLVVACTPTAGSNALSSNAPERSPVASAPTAAGAVPTVRVLQLNLCNSGIAACYTGRSRTQAATVIRAEAPDLVTLNEVCRDDLPPLRQALADALPDADVVTAFQAARDRRTGAEFRCRNGESYGIGVVSRWPPAPGSSAGEGIFPDQDLQDPEERVWLCLTAQSIPAITACTTHLDDRKREVAVAQCDYLFQTVITELRQKGAAPLVVLGGDLNLGSDDDPDLRSCLPADFGVADDGGVQHIVASPGLVVSGSRTIDLGDTTDHPGLLVTLLG
jgi:endonuclease/exonuclease/phosphatase family metal-dependent hydrolase